LLTIAGFQVPVIPFVDGDDNRGAVPFAQMDETTLKTGIIVSTVIFNFAVVTHSPEVGVKV
jgi:hypothetical protein